MTYPDIRGTALFSSESLQRVYNEIVAPEIDNEHHLIGVGSITRSGLKGALVYHRPIDLMGVRGEWRIEGAFLYNWSGEHDVEAKILFKL